MEDWSDFDGGSGVGVCDVSVVGDDTIVSNSPLNRGCSGTSIDELSQDSSRSIRSPAEDRIFNFEIISDKEDDDFGRGACEDRLGGDSDDAEDVRFLSGDDDRRLSEEEDRRLKDEEDRLYKLPNFDLVLTLLMSPDLDEYWRVTSRIRMATTRPGNLKANSVYISKSASPLSPTRRNRRFGKSRNSFSRGSRFFSTAGSNMFIRL